jgi:hypothetical protein
MIHDFYTIFNENKQRGDEAMTNEINEIYDIGTVKLVNRGPV